MIGLNHAHDKHLLATSESSRRKLKKEIVCFYDAQATLRFDGLMKRDIIITLSHGFFAVLPIEETNQF